MASTEDERALLEINKRMLSGDVERGNAVLERIIRLSPITDKQQLFMYRTETITPQDARDFITALAAHGMVVVATEANADAPPDAVAQIGGPA